MTPGPRCWRPSGRERAGARAPAGELMLAGPRDAVLTALGDALEAALSAGAHGLEVRLGGADGVPRVNVAPVGRARARLIAVARGDEAPDTVIEGARVFCAHTREWLDGDVAVADGLIAGIGSYEGGERIDARGRWLVPGAHRRAHARGVLEAHASAVRARRAPPRDDRDRLRPARGRQRARLRRRALDARRLRRRLPLSVFVMAPSCVPASAFESPRRELTVGDMEAILRRRRGALGVAEMMNFPGVIAGDRTCCAKLEVRGASHADGHAPGVMGRALDAYAAAGDRLRPRGGPRSRRRSRSAAAACGCCCARRPTRATCGALLPLVRDHGPDCCARSAPTTAGPGHAPARGPHQPDVPDRGRGRASPPRTRWSWRPSNAARAHGLDGLGAIAPAPGPTSCSSATSERFEPSLVLAGGRVAARDGPRRAVRRSRPRPRTCSARSASAPISEADLVLEADGPVRVIEIVPEQLITIERTVDPARENGHVVADPARDLAKIAVIERHHATGRVGRGLVTGFGLAERRLRLDRRPRRPQRRRRRRPTPTGSSPAAPACKSSGAAASSPPAARVTGELPLPVAGLLSDLPGRGGRGALDALHEQLARARGRRSRRPL